MDYYALVKVSCASESEAKTVLAERIGYDESYGFDYKIDWTEPSETVPNYWPVVRTAGGLA